MTPERKSLVLLKNALRDAVEKHNIYIRTGSGATEEQIDAIEEESGQLQADIKLLETEPFDASLALTLIGNCARNNQDVVDEYEPVMKQYPDAFATKEWKQMLEKAQANFANLKAAEKILNAFNKIEK